MLIVVAPALIGCRDDLKEIVVVDARPMRRLAAPFCGSIIVQPLVEWDSELEIGCAGGMPCSLQAADPRSCLERSEGVPAVDAAQSIVAAARFEPRCDGIVVIESATLGSGPARRSIQQPYWILEVAHPSSEPRHPWVLMRSEIRGIGGYGQGTVPEIVGETCALVREGATPRKRPGNGP